MAKGYSKHDSIDFKETFSPMSTKDSLSIMMAIIAHFDLELHHMDVRTTFLNGDLVEDVYISNLFVLRKLVRTTWFVNFRNPFNV